MPGTGEKESTKPEEKQEQTKAKGKGKEKKEELSEEDQKKKQDLEFLVVSVKENVEGVQKLALTQLQTEIKSSTSSMTSIPKPLKFLRPHYGTLKEVFAAIAAGENKHLLADVLSVLAMTMGAEGARESLNFKLQGVPKDIGSWGHEYVRNLSGEIGEEYNKRIGENQPVDDLLGLVKEIIPFDMKHNAEHEACDLLLEVEKLEWIVDLVDEANHSRVCLYLLACANYVPEPEDSEVLRIAMAIYRKLNKHSDALRVALRLASVDDVKDIFENCTDPSTKKQLAFMLARHHVPLNSDDPDLAAILTNSKLTEFFMELARDLEVTEPKLPEDIYKSHLTETRSNLQSAVTDSARQNLASSFVNGFVNAGFGQDKLIGDDGKWIYKNKDHGMLSAAASLGLLLLWDVDTGITKVDKWLYVKEDFVKAGALLAIGIINTGVRNECDPALGMLLDYVDSPTAVIKISAILGLGLAYAGTAREDFLEKFTTVIDDSKSNAEVISITALALGLIFVGTCNATIAETIMQALLERDEATLTNPHARFLCLGLGLLYLGKQQQADTTLEAIKALKGPLSQFCAFTVEACAYTGTGNVLKVQQFLHACGERLEKDNSHQSIAVLGIAMVATGEELGAEMAMRSFDHLLQYGELVIRRSVPLALGLLCTSNPLMTVVDTLSKLSHDGDDEVAQSAIFALGLVGAGTNNARIANMLRQLSGYYYKNPNHLFMVRIAQSLVHMGKGTLSLNPFHSDRLLLSPVAMSGLLSTLFSCLDLKNLVLAKSHYLLFCLSTAMYPRMLMTVDEDLKPLQVNVRVGQAVDTVGQAGKPKTITGFQTHTTPVLLSHGERAELVTNAYLPLASNLEGFVILKKNPDYKEQK